MARGFDNINPNANSRGDKLKPEEIWDLFKFTDQSGYVSVRFLPTDILPVKTHWIKILAGKDKKEIKIPKICISFDPDNEAVALDGTDCPYCNLSQGQDGACQTSTAYYANVIVRDLQEDMPRKLPPHTKSEKETGYKDIKSRSWTPVRVVRLPAGLAGKIQEMRERNKDKKGNMYPVSHEEYGIDIAIKFDDSKSGTDKYQIDKEERSPLDDEELDYLTYDLSVECIDMLGRESQEQADTEFKRLDIVGEDEIEDDEDDEEDDLPRRSKKGSKGRRRASVDDEDEEDEEDDEEDDLPRSRRGKKSSSRRSRRSSIDEDDDEDEDEDEDEEESRSSRRSKRSSSRSSRRSRRSEPEDDEDEDEDDEPRSRRSKRSSTKTSSSRRRRAPVDEDEEEDEDDEPRSRRSRTSSKTRSSSRSRSRRR